MFPPEAAVFQHEFPYDNSHIPEYTYQVLSLFSPRIGLIPSGIVQNLFSLYQDDETQVLQCI